MSVVSRLIVDNGNDDWCMLLNNLSAVLGTFLGADLFLLVAGNLQSENIKLKKIHPEKLAY